MKDINMLRKLIKKVSPKVVLDSLNSTGINELFNMFILKRAALSRADHSFAGELDTLEKLTTSLHIVSGFIVDIAASDGVTQSCTLRFFQRMGWSGLAVEMDATKFAYLAFVYANLPNAQLARTKVTPSNIKALLDSYEVPSDISILNLDIDSYDLYVMKSILLSGFRPKIITMEVNEKIPSGIFFAVHFDDHKTWQSDHFYGCSLDAACSVVKPFGYILFAMNYNNAIFLRRDLPFNDFPDLDSETAYNNGYKLAKDRKTLFPWNVDVEQWLHSNTDETIEMIRNFFNEYEGQFSLYGVSD
jgi:hypothetical protein